MASTQSPKVPRMRQARKSIAHMPSTEVGGDKENLTIDTAAIETRNGHGKQVAKKLRSKSIGPGSLDALKEDTGNKQPSLPPQVKSILKTTTIFSPPKAIPPHNGGRKASPGKAKGPTTPRKSPKKSPRKNPLNGTPALTKHFGASPKAAASKILSPARSPARVAVRTEEEQQAAALERERQEALAHKDAKRKSLANRRVSFAPEATLHTWNVVELPEDSTTSSASTNSTRRASNLTANAGSPFTTPNSPMPSPAASEPPSTPPEQGEELQVAASPAHQRDMHQKKRRRSSVIPPMNFNNPEELSSSPYSGVEDDTNQSFVTADEIDKNSECSSSNDNDLVEDVTVTRVDGEDNTLRSTGSNSTGSSGRLDAALQQAAAQAGTQGIDYDEHGDITMEMADDEITNAFKPWMKKGKYVPQVIGDPSALQDQENLNPFSPAFKANVTRNRSDDDGTMEMTQAMGRILPTPGENQGSPKRRRRNSVAGSNQTRTSVARRRSSGEGSAFGDETMDLTMAMGGIQQDQQAPRDETQGDHRSDDDDEELTMEFTSVIGGVVQPSSKISALDNDDALANQQLLHDAARRESGGFSDNEETMDMTIAAGGILPTITERTEPMDEQTQEMDITSAIGAILPEQLSTGNKAGAKLLMEHEADVGQLSGLPFFGTPRQKPVGVGLTDERPLPGHLKTVASETGSPSLANFQPQNQLRKSVGSGVSVTPRSQQASPFKKPMTPSKQLTPQPIRPLTPGKTPPSKNVSMRTSSPKKLFNAEIKAERKNTSNSTLSSATANPLFHTDVNTGSTTPSVILKPRRRRSSGLGLDREGLGSPRVTEILDRRGSIGENAKMFVCQGPAPGVVRFDDPQIMEQELDQERAEDRRRESGRGIMEDEADTQDLEEKDVTANLKDMIDSLTPQKKKLKGRKSLHVGAAKGLLGKRPPELDEIDDEEDTPKRLKGREGSPVKKIKLPAPPSKAATTGRVTRSTRLSLVDTTGNARLGTPTGTISPIKTDTTPRGQARFKDAESKSPAKVTPFEQKLDTDSALEVEPKEKEDRIHLQNFLNMTNIKFIELTTTKRRHTVVPNANLEQNAKKVGNDADQEVPSDLESCVVTSACTLPMLELYQHSCRELKNYISEGRNIVKEIEVDTYQENPPLFREYISAPPDVKLNMDAQFKNVKTHARLLSKAMWYEWRMKLLDGLKEGLVKIREGMDQDERVLTQQEQMMRPVLPSLIEHHDHLENQVQIARAQAEELAECDQDELREARESLMSVEKDLENKRNLVEELQSQLRERENILGDVLEQKQECIVEIKEAEKTRQDCRGWSFAEVSALQASVDSLEANHGWAITVTAESALTMAFDRTLQLFFTPSSFRTPNEKDAPASLTAENSPISLTYIADTVPYRPQPLNTEKRFFLQIMRAQLQCLQQSLTSTKNLLNFVSTSWKTVSRIADEIHLLNVGYITEVTIKSDEVMVVKSVILLQEMRTKVEVCFEVKVCSGDGITALGVNVEPSAKVCYGEGLKEKKMGEFLKTKIKGVEGRGVWVKAVGELEERLKARGKKA